jgi:hypothetical protein
MHGAIFVLAVQYVHCWSLYIYSYSVRSILVEFPTCLAHIQLVTCPAFGAINICLVFLSVINKILCL